MSAAVDRPHEAHPDPGLEAEPRAAGDLEAAGERSPPAGRRDGNSVHRRRVAGSWVEGEAGSVRLDSERADVERNPPAGSSAADPRRRGPERSAGRRRAPLAPRSCRDRRAPPARARGAPGSAARPCMDPPGRRAAELQRRRSGTGTDVHRSDFRGDGQVAEAIPAWEQ